MQAGGQAIAVKASAAVRSDVERLFREPVNAFAALAPNDRSQNSLRLDYCLKRTRGGSFPKIQRDDGMVKQHTCALFERSIGGVIYAPRSRGARS